MVPLLALITMLLTLADHWTTYLCLRAPVVGWTVSEANPIADWLFASAGLVPGLLIDTVITVLAVTFLLATRRLPRVAKSLCFALISSSTGYAVMNNLGALDALGISPLGLWS